MKREEQFEIICSLIVENCSRKLSCSTNKVMYVSQRNFSSVQMHINILYSMQQVWFKYLNLRCQHLPAYKPIETVNRCLAEFVW